MFGPYARMSACARLGLHASMTSPGPCCVYRSPAMSGLSWAVGDVHRLRCESSGAAEMSRWWLISSGVVESDSHPEPVDVVSAQIAGPLSAHSRFHKGWAIWTHRFRPLRTAGSGSPTGRSGSPGARFSVCDKAEPALPRLDACVTLASAKSARPKQRHSRAIPGRPARLLHRNANSHADGHGHSCPSAPAMQHSGAPT